MYPLLNSSSSKRFGYYFAPKALKADLGLHALGKRMIAFLLISIVSLAWVPIKDHLDRKKQSFFKLEKIRKYREEKLEREHIFQVISFYETGLTEPQEKRLAQGVQDFSKEYGLDPYLTLAVIRTESYYNHRAVSFAGAEGLMQILPPTGMTLAQEMGIHFEDRKLLFHPMINIYMGTRYLSQLIHAFQGDVFLALLAYNRGPQDVQKNLQLGAEIPSHYAKEVWLHYDRLIKKRNQELNQLAHAKTFVPRPIKVPSKRPDKGLLASFQIPLP